MPDASNFAEWRRRLYLQTIAASARGSDATAAWIHETDAPGTVPESFAVVDPKWASLDAPLALSLIHIRLRRLSPSSSTCLSL